LLTQISFIDFEKEGICFAYTMGTCDTPDFMDIFSDQYGECVATTIYGDCYCYGDLTEDCAGVCNPIDGPRAAYDCREGDGEYPQTTSALQGYCDGTADYEEVVEDCAGVCDGPGLTNTGGDSACCATGNIDCNNECDGEEILTACGCGESTTDTNGCCADGESPNGEGKDCAGTCGGSAELDCADY
jgi:hypothetical protein